MTPYGTLPDGRTIHAVSIANDRLAATFLTYGARLVDCRFDDSGSLVPAVTLENLPGDEAYFGAILGPVMNRLGRAQAPLDGEVLRFTANEGANLLHSGDAGFHAQIWQVAEETDNSVTFRLDLAPDSFPGNRRVDVTYRLDGADLVLEIAATTDAPTLMNAGFHPYWTMTGGGPETHEVTIAAPGYLPMDAGNIPTGEIADVTGTPFDFRSAKVPGGDIDHCFVLEPRDRVAFAYRMTGGGLALDVLTDAPALHVFTGKPVGIAVEPEIHPDAPNHDGFPSIRLGPGETFRQTVVHRFSHA